MSQIGLGYRREMADWDMSAVLATFFEVAPENWLRRDISPLQALVASGRPVYLHGVSLNLGGYSALNEPFLQAVRALMQQLDCPFYSDHLAASGDAHQLYDLFPIPSTAAEVIRVSDRIKAVQDVLGCVIAIENSTWYTNCGDIPEPDFLMHVVERAGCQILLDLNNIVVNQKNHGGFSLVDYVARIDLNRVSYLHVAGHEWDARLGMYIDTHSQPVEAGTRQLAGQLAAALGLPILLEWDNDVPTQAVLNEELLCLASTIMCAA